MTKNENQVRSVTEVASELCKIIPFLLAGLEGSVEEWDVSGISLQSDDNGGFKVVLRARSTNAQYPAASYVSYSNGDSAAETLSLAEAAFRDGLARWYLDRFRNGDSLGGAETSGGSKLTLRK